MKTLAELEKELIEHDKERCWDTAGFNQIKGQLAVMKEWHVEEMIEILKELKESDVHPAILARIHILLAKLEGKK